MGKIRPQELESFAHGNGDRILSSHSDVIGKLQGELRHINCPTLLVVQVFFEAILSQMILTG